MRQRCAVAVIAVLLVAGGPVFASTEPAYANVQQEIEQGNLSGAQAILQQALAANNGDFRAHLLLGIVFQEEGRSGDAIKQFDRARQLRPNDPAAYVNKGRVLASEGELELAAEQFAAATRLDPNNTTAHGNWGIVLYHQQRWRQAIAQLRESVSLEPRDVTSWVYLFQAYLATKDFEAARTASGQVERLSPHTAETYRTLGTFQAKAGDYPDAIISLRKALELDPDSPEAGYNLALALMRDGRVDDARIRIGKA